MSELDTYLSQVFPNTQVREHVLDLLSQILKGTRQEHKVFVFQGPGSNGKSTFLNLIRMVMGSLSVSVSENVLYTNKTNSRSFEHFLESLKDKRLLICETSEDFVPTWLKSCLGGDPISYRPLYQNERSFFIPNFDVVLVTNMQMVYQGSDISRRVEVIPFESTFLNDLDPNNTHQFKRANINDQISKWETSFTEKLSSL